MSTYPQVPISEIRESDGHEQLEGETSDLYGQAMRAMKMDKGPDETNYATDKKVADYIQQQIYPVIRQLRMRRASLESEWVAIRKMDLLVHDDGQRYRGRSNAYIPVFSKTVSTTVSTLSKGMFPSDDYMDVYDRGTGDTEVARALKAYMQYEFEDVAQVRRYMKPFLRQFSMFGNACLKFWYEKDLKRIGKSKKLDAEVLLRGYEDDDAEKMGGAYQEGLRVSTRSMFNIYVAPETAECPAELTMIGEDIELPISYIKRQGELGRYINTEIAVMSQRDEQTYNKAELLQDMARLPYDGRQFQQYDIAGTVQVTEVWTYMNLPASAYQEGENPEFPVPVRIVMSGDQAMSVIRNPYYHQCAPYLFGRQNIQAGVFYGSGIGRTTRYLQYLANDFTNQANDVGIYALNPIMLVNPSTVVGTLPPLRPGVTFRTTDTASGIRFDRPPTDLVQVGQGLLAQYIGMVQDFGGAPPVLQGTGAGKGAKTATGAQILQRNALAPLQDIVEDLEGDVLVPLMRGAWRNAMQFRDKELMLRVMGIPTLIRPQDLAIDASFRWVASSQAANQQQRAQQAIGFVQALMPLLPVLNQLGYVVDPAPLLKKVYNDGFGFRGFDELIKKSAQGPMPQQGQIPPQGMAGPGGQPGQSPAGPEQADRIRSTLEQLNGGPSSGQIPDIQPGEGDDFMQVRNNADELAALEGSVGMDSGVA